HESQGQAEPSCGGDLRVPEREGRRGGGRHHEGAGHRRQRQSRFRDQEERGGDRGLEVPEAVAVTRVLLWLAVAACSTLAAPAARGCGPRSGCWATTSPPPAGPRAARSTSWRTSARNPAAYTVRCTAPGTPVRAASAARMTCPRARSPTPSTCTPSSGSRPR